MMNHGIHVLLITFIVHKALVSTQECSEFGAVRLYSTVPNVGRVDFCNGSQWGTICSDGWDHFDAAVVCRELGYTADGAQTMHYAINDAMIENVNCYWDELRLRDCNYTVSHRGRNCTIAGVRCKVIKNITFVTVNRSVLITWEYNNKTSQQSSSFNVRCNGQRHYNNDISVSNGASRFSDIVGDLLPNVSYDCCVSAKYAQSTGAIVTTEIRCASIKSGDLLPSDTNNMTASVTVDNTISDSNNIMTATVVGAVLGCIIVILLVLLAVCGGALFHALRSRSRTSSEVPKRSATEVAVGRNVSYLGTPPSTASGAQATDTVAGHTPGAATEYSRIGPSYETIGDSNPSSRQQPLPSGGNRVSANFSERYEFSEPHLATGQGGGGSGVGQREAAPVEYEVPLKSGERMEYSHLQH